MGISELGELCRVSFLQGREAAAIAEEWQRDWEYTSFTLGKIPKKFETLPLVAVGTEMQKQVWLEIMRIPRGETASYGEIAERIEMPGRARAVGRACRDCRISYIIPCHRVIAAKGLGGYGNDGLNFKEILLKAEGVVVQR